MVDRWQEARDLIARFKSAALLFAANKESTLLSELVEGGLDMPVLFADTGPYPPEIYRYLIRERQLPYCELYDQGLRDVGCEPCSRARGGQGADRDEIERRLRALGYL